MTTGLLIKTARKKANMTQAKLASKMGITNHCISCWEKGKRNPKYETLSRIADALGVDVNYLLTGSDAAADVVAVVRCKDCKFYEIHKPSVLENCERKGLLIPMKPDDFCSYGERKDDNA